MKKLLMFILIMMFSFTLAGCKEQEQELDCNLTPEYEECLPEIEPVDYDSLYPNRGTYYQIFVRSFSDSDGDGIGDFNGITEKLDYLEELGIDNIWLMPIHPSPTYHGYDVTDYYAVNPEYGTMEDFENLLAAADERGINIIIDLVINHTSSEHPWFTEWRNDNPDYQGWYRKIRSSDERFEINRSAWHTYGDGYYYAGLFGHTMPDLNWSNPAVQEEMLNVALFWMEKGVSGFRLDAILHLEGHGEVLPPTVPIESSIEKLALWNFGIEMEYPDVYLAGEVWDGFSVFSKFVAATDSSLNFEVGADILYTINRGSNDEYVEDMMDMIDALEAIDPDAIDAPFLYNHDQDRLASILGGDMTKLKQAAELLLTREGNPFIYYGEELGMFGIKSTGPDIWDETRRQPYLFSDDSLTSWMVDPYNDSVDDVDTQLADSESLLNLYKTLLNVRQDSIALTYGDTEAWELSSSVLQGFYRTFYHDEHHNQRVLVLHNVGENPFTYGDIEGEILYYSPGIDTYDGIIEGQSTIIIEVEFETE